MDLIQRLGNDSAPVKRGCFTVGVCPVEGGPHAARMTAELALLAARQSDSRILMIETNPVHRLVESVFDLGKDAPGLGEMLAPPPNNRFDTIHPTSVPNLFVMPAGSMRQFPGKEQLTWVHSILSSHFQGIAIELPPMGEMRAREFCAKIPNAVLLVSHAGCGSWSIKRAVKRLHAAHANLVGTTLVR
jgi:hypothetical protein